MRNVSTIRRPEAHLQNKLLFSVRVWLPMRCLRRRLLGGRHFAGKAGDDAGGIRGCWAVWAMADQESRAGTTSSEIFLPKLSATETARVNKRLLIVAEDLFGGKAERGGPELTGAGGHHDDILFTRVVCSSTQRRWVSVL